MLFILIQFEQTIKKSKLLKISMKLMFDFEMIAILISIEMYTND